MIVRVEGRLVPAVAKLHRVLIPRMVAVGIPGLAVTPGMVSVIVALKKSVVQHYPISALGDVGA